MAISTISRFQVSFFTFVVNYTGPTGRVMVGADTKEELINFLQQNPIKGWGGEGTINEEWLILGTNIKEYLGNGNYFEAVIGFPPAWETRHVQINWTYQEAIEGEAKPMALLNVSYQVPLGTSDEELQFRLELAYKQAKADWLEAQFQAYREVMLPLMQKWVEAHKDSRVKAVHIKAHKTYRLNEFSTEMVFDLGGSNTSSNINGYAISHANPRCTFEEVEAMWKDIIEGKYDYLVKKPKKVIAPPKRLNK